MANRHTLARTKLNDFVEWLISDGWKIQEPKGSYEVLRATKEGRKHPLIVYKRHPARSTELEHYTICDRDCGVVGAYIRDRKIHK